MNARVELPLLMQEANDHYPLRTTQGYDHKAWAKRIMYRFERNDNDLLQVQITFAQTALDIKPAEAK